MPTDWSKYEIKEDEWSQYEVVKKKEKEKDVGVSSLTEEKPISTFESDYPEELRNDIAKRLKVEGPTTAIAPTTLVRSDLINQGKLSSKDLSFDDWDAFNKSLERENPIREARAESITLEDPDEPSYGKKLLDGVSQTSSQLMKNIAQTPGFIYDIANVPSQLLADLTGWEKIRGGTPKWMKDNAITKHFDQEIKQLKKTNEVYDKQITGYLRAGEYDKAVGLLGVQVAQSLPYMTALAMGGWAGATAKQIIPAVAVVSGAEKKEELEDVDIPEATKTFNAIASGLAEGALEYAGTVKIAALGKEMFKKYGKKEAQRIMKDGFEKTMKNAMMKMYPVTGAVGEGIEEASTTFSQNLIDRYTGVDPERNPMEGVGDSFIVGVGAGAGMATGIKTAQKIVEPKIKEDVTIQKPSPKEVDVREQAKAREGIREEDQIKEPPKEEVTPEKIETEVIKTATDTSKSLEEVQKKTGEERIAQVPIKNQEQINKDSAKKKNIEDVNPIASRKENRITMDINETELMKAWNKYFMAKGHLPESVFQEQLKSKGRINARLKDIDYTKREYESALKKVYGRGINKSEIERINNVFSRLGEKTLERAYVLEEIPDELHESLINMRDQIDNLSREMIKEGLVEGELQGKFEENLGYYMTRTYRTHNDPKWKYEKIPHEIKNRTISYLRDNYKNLTEDQIEGKMRELLDGPDMPLGMIKAGKLGAKDLSILKQRKDIPEVIRDWLGEYKDPLYNYATSVSKMVNIIEKNKFLNTVRDQGLNDFLFKTPQGKHAAKIAAKGTKTLDPLNGLYTTPEIKEAFEIFDKAGEALPTYMQHIMKMNSLIKYSKTILSPQTHVRNYISNYGFHLANGRFFKNPKLFIKSHGDIFNEVTNNPKYKDRIKRLIELGVVGESARARELQESLKESVNNYNEFDRYSENLFNKIKNKSRKVVEKAYQAEDDVHKIFAFEYEKANYRDTITKENKGKSEKEIEEILDRKAAEIVRKTMPTYSLVPRFVTTIRRTPFVGTFVSFPYEVLRTSFNTVQLATQEIRNPNTRRIGIRRMAGIMTATAATGLMASMSRNLLGIGENEEDDIRRFVAPWTENSDIFFLKDRGKGVYDYIDVGYSDPHNILKKTFRAFVRGEGFTDSMIDAIKEVAGPFIGEEILYSKVNDIIRNKDKNTGKQIYNPELSAGDQAVQMTKHLWGAFEPGAMTSTKRIAKSFKDHLDDEGKGYDPRNEITAVLTGQRRSVVDVGRSFGFKIRKAGKRIYDAQSIYIREQYNKKATEKDKLKAFEKTQESLMSIFNDMNEDYRAAIRLGVSRGELNNKIDMLRIENIPASKDLKRIIKTGNKTMIKQYLNDLKYR